MKIINADCTFHVPGEKKKDVVIPEVNCAHDQPRRSAPRPKSEKSATIAAQR